MSLPTQHSLAQRALVLQQQRRYADAEREWRQVLTMDPHDARAHAMLALCLAERKEYAQASREADAATGLAPDEPYVHYVRAKVLYDRNRYDDAADAVGQAIRLDALDPDSFQLLGAVRFEQRLWPAALAAAEEGLKADPDHPGCANLRAMALVKLGRRGEAGATIGAALARNPENAVTHANQGWALLHEGQPRKAMEHFREALRLDPELEWARAGIVEALKAHNFVYRWMLLYFLWMSRLSGQAQWGIILGGWFGSRALRAVARTNPELAPFVLPVIIAYVIFVLMTWLADPLFNLMLRVSRFGRLVLSREQTIASNLIGGLLLGAVAALAAGLVVEDVRLLRLAVVLGLLMLPTSGVFHTPVGWPRWVMISATALLAVVGAAAAGIVWLAPADAEPKDDPLVAIGVLLMNAFTVGVLVTTLAYNYLRSVRPSR